MINDFIGPLEGSVTSLLLKSTPLHLGPSQNLVTLKIKYVSWKLKKARNPGCNDAGFILKNKLRLNNQKVS